MLHIDIKLTNRFMVTIIIILTIRALIRNLTFILYTWIETIVVIEILVLCRIKLLQRAVDFLAKTGNILSERLEFSLFLRAQSIFLGLNIIFLFSRKTFVFGIKELIK